MSSTKEAPGLVFEVPIRTGRGQNDRGNWKARHFGSRTKERAAVLAVTRAYQPVAGVQLGKLLAKMAAKPVTVTLTRVAPPRSKGLDGDNLRGALKNVRDALAGEMGLVDDRESERLEWRYEQARGPWGVRVEVAARKPEVQGPGWTAAQWLEVATSLRVAGFFLPANEAMAKQAEAMARALGGGG